MATTRKTASTENRATGSDVDAAIAAKSPAPAVDDRGYIGLDAADIIDAGNGRGTDATDLHVSTVAIDVRGDVDPSLPGGHVNDPTVPSVVGSKG